jgi:hypothetical protein
MKFTEFLNEKYLNLFINTKDAISRNEYKDEVYELLQKAYKDIGGIKGNGFNSADDMVKNMPFWKIAKVKGKIVAIILYKDKNGRKAVAMATDGSRDGILKLKDILKNELSRSYMEASSNALRFAIKFLGVELLKKYAISIDDVKQLLHDDEILEGSEKYKTDYPDLADYFYSRKIGSSIETKIMIGTPNLKINSYKCIYIYMI